MYSCKGPRISGREIWVCKHTSSSSSSSSSSFPYISLEWGFSIRAGWSDSTSQNREKGGEEIASVRNKTVMHFSFFPLVCLSPSFFLFPFLSFFFAAVKIGFSLLVNAGGAAAAAAAMSRALCKPPFPECEILPRRRRSCE